MVPRERLPATAWHLRKCGSRPARYVYACILAIVFVPAVMLRVEAALFEKRAIATARALSTLQVGVTPKAEALARMQKIGLITRQYGPPVCFSEECFSAVMPNSYLSNAVFVPADRTQSPLLYSVLARWGFHFSRLSIDVHFTSGKVSFYSYDLMLSASRFEYGADAIMVLLTSQEKLLGPREGAAYHIKTSRYLPDKMVSIELTPYATQELVNRAFDVNLHCLWSLAGCKTWREVLPNVEAD